MLCQIALRPMPFCCNLLLSLLECGISESLLPFLSCALLLMHATRRYYYENVRIMVVRGLSYHTLALQNTEGL